MSEKSVLNLKIENTRPGIGDQLVKCPLFGGDIYFEQCHRIEQAINEVYALVRIDKVTVEHVTDNPFAVETLLTPRLQKYVKPILKASRGWGEANKICNACRAKPQGEGLRGTVYDMNPGLQPVRRTD